MAESPDTTKVAMQEPSSHPTGTLTKLNKNHVGPMQVPPTGTQPELRMSLTRAALELHRSRAIT